MKLNQMTDTQLFDAGRRESQPGIRNPGPGVRRTEARNGRPKGEFPRSPSKHLLNLRAEVQARLARAA